MKIIKSKNVQETLLNIVLIIGGFIFNCLLFTTEVIKTSQKDMMVGR